MKKHKEGKGVSRGGALGVGAIPALGGDCHSSVASGGGWGSPSAQAATANNKDSYLPQIWRPRFQDASRSGFPMSPCGLFPVHAHTPGASSSSHKDTSPVGRGPHPDDLA